MKRRLTKLVLFLLLGAVVNVAVAWGCATFPDLMAKESDLLVWTLDEEERWFVRKWEHPGAAFYASLRIAARSHPNYPPPPGPHPSNVVPNQGSLAVPRPGYAQDSIGIDSRGVSLRGWPMLAMWCEYPRRGRPEILTVAGGIQLPLDEGGFREYWPMFRSTWPKVLPLRIVWPGFLFNTALYAAVLWLIFAAPFTARRIIRQRRGRCINCGYDLSHAEHEVCPECGLGREVVEAVRRN